MSIPRQDEVGILRESAHMVAGRRALRQCDDQRKARLRPRRHWGVHDQRMNETQAPFARSDRYHVYIGAQQSRRRSQLRMQRDVPLHST